MTTICYTDNTSQVNGAAADSVVSGNLVSTHLRESDATTNYSTSSELIGKYSTSGDYKTSIIRVDLSALVGATINSATFYSWTVNRSAPTSMDYHRILVANAQGTATWNTTDGSTAWTTAGCLSDGNDRAASPFASQTSWNFGAYNSVSFTSEIAAIAAGTSNYGWLYVAVGTDGQFISDNSESGTDSQRPELLIDYTVASGPSIPILTHHIRQQS